MAVPSYTTDLTSGVISNGEETTGYTEPTGATAGAITMNDSDFFIQGSACCSKTQAAVGYGGLIYNSGSAKTIPSPGAVFVWMFYAATSTLASEAAGGFRIIIGSATTAFRHWYVRGVDTYAYGGWICVPVDPTVAGDTNTGTPNMASLQYFGTIAYVPGPGYAQRGNPHGLDAMRYGRGESRIANGSTADGYATFLGYATTNDNQSNRWGLIQAVAPGVHSAGYLVQGLVIFGYGAATDFRDSNTSIVINDTKKVVSSFNAFEVRNALSRVDLTAISFTALGTTSRGNWITTDNADVNLDTCTFTDMDTFTFLSASAALSCTFRRCNAVTVTGSDLRGSGFRTPTVAADASGLVWTDTTETDGLLDNATFSKGTNAHHAISFASTTTNVDYTLRGIDFTGFNATSASNDSAIYVAATTGTITIYLIGCSGSITAKSAGATVTFFSNPVTVSITTKDVGGAVVGSANVFLTAASGGLGILPAGATVSSITRINSTTAEATHAAAHNMSTGDKVYIQGANQAAYNGVFTITLVGVATPTTMYRYTLASDPGTNATGTLTATFVFLKGTTDVGTGVLSMSRVISANQNVIGWARKYSTPPNYTPPNYKTSDITGTVLSSADFSTTVLLISDD